MRRVPTPWVGDVDELQLGDDEGATIDEAFKCLGGVCTMKKGLRCSGLGLNASEDNLSEGGQLLCGLRACVLGGLRLLKNEINCYLNSYSRLYILLY